MPPLALKIAGVRKAFREKSLRRDYHILNLTRKIRVIFLICLCSVMFITSCHVCEHVNMPYCLQITEKASYVISVTLTCRFSFLSLSSTLIPVIHTVCLSLSLFSSFALLFLLAKFHTTCSKQSRFTDYHPLHAKHITHAHM